ncbi:hypothetical protein GQ473_02980, partial [archaeon]|nr:hypothetical protein [archaeon]
PTGSPQNLSGAWVQSVQKMGMWGTKYATKDDMLLGNNMTSTCDGTTNNCVLKFNLSNFEQGEYEFVIAANNSDGDIAESWYWMRVETLRISVPELMDYMIARETHTMNNKTKVTFSESCGSDNDVPIEPNNITNCKYGATRMVNKIAPQADWESYNWTYFLLEKENGTLYVNASMVENDWSVNFTGLTALSENDTFLDGAGNNWSIVEIDTSSNTITLEVIDGVIAYNKDNWNDQENTYSETYLFNLDVSISKSGKFLRADDLEDNEWSNVDLDNDGVMSWDERYYVILADTNISGIYDTVYVSNSTNFTNAIVASPGVPINFSTDSDVNSIYLLKKKYNSGSSGNTNYYQLVYTTNNPGWPGRDIGIYQPNSTLKVPIYVTEPSNKSKGIENATVRIKNLVKFGYNGETNIPLTTYVDVNTTNTGFALIDVNLSGVLNGDYFVKVEVEYNGENVTTATIWDNPRVAVRNFVVRGEIGLKGLVDGITKWDVDENVTDELWEGNLVHMDCNWGSYNCSENNFIFSVRMWPYEDILYYNATNGIVLVDGDKDYNLSNAEPYNPATQLVGVKKYNNNTEFLNVSVFGNDIGISKYTVIPMNGSVGNIVDAFHNFTITSNNGTNANITITQLEPWGYWMFVKDENVIIGSNISKDQGPTPTFTVTNVTVNFVNISWNWPSMLMKSGIDIQGKNKIARIWDAGNGYSLIVYNSPLLQTVEDLDMNNPWKDAADSVMVINSTTGVFVDEYALGVPIDELSGKLVIRSNKWDERIYLSDKTLGGRNIASMPWTCDNNNDMYVVNFTEQSAKMKIKETWDEANFTTNPYYMLFFDGDCNGVKDVTHALFDDDPVFDDKWYQDEYEQWVPRDGDHSEEGSPEWMGDSFNMSERWMDIGRENWPFTITDFNVNNATLFSFRDWSTKENNLTLWVSANDFEGKPINGNISVKEMKGMVFDCGPPQEQIISITNIEPMVDGVGYFELDLGNMSMGDYSIRFEITAEDGTKEILEKHLWLDDKEAMEECMGEESTPKF